MNQKGFANILLIGAIAILVVIGGYFVFFKESCRLESPPDLYVCGSYFSSFINSFKKPVLVNPTQIPDGAKDETVNWKTYTNAKYGFEVKYPESYFEFHKSGDSSISFRSTEGCKMLISGGGAWPSDCQAYDVGVQQNKIVAEGVDINTSKTLVTGIQAEKITINYGMWDNMTQVVVQFQRGQNWYIQTFTFNQGKSKIAESVMNQILASFRFIN